MHFPCLKKNIDNFRHECNILTEKSKEKRYKIRFLRKIERMHTKVGEIEHQTAFGLKRFFVCFDSILEVGKGQLISKGNFSVLNLPKK